MRGARLKRPYLTRAKLDGLKYDEELRELISRYDGKQRTDTGTGC
jgi:hypothetical protein